MRRSRASTRRPASSLAFEDEGERLVVRLAPDQPAILVNGEPLRDDPSNDIPLEFVREDGSWRLLNCGDYVP